jgi:hypothetical protein
MHHMVDLILVNRMKLSNLKRQSACQSVYRFSWVWSPTATGGWKWYVESEGYRGSHGGVMKVPRPYLLSSELLLNFGLPR